MIRAEWFVIPGLMSQVLSLLGGLSLYLLSYAMDGAGCAYASLAGLCLVLFGLYLPLKDPTEPAYILLGVIVFYFIPRQLILILEQLPLMGHLAPAEYVLMRYGNILVGAGAMAFHVSYQACKAVRFLPDFRAFDRTPGVLSSLIAAGVISFVALAALARRIAANAKTGAAWTGI